MKRSIRALLMIAAVVFLVVSVIGMNNDGGVRAVLRDEVPPLTVEWFGETENAVKRYVTFIPAGVAVAIGMRAGAADYDRSGPLRVALTEGIPLHLRDDVMQYDNLAAAQRARRRQLRRMASTNTEQVFYDRFPYWWSDETACLTSSQEFERIRTLAPAIAASIDAKNAEFEALAVKEMDNTLTVAERQSYLAEKWRVPHLVKLPKLTSSILEMEFWEQVDPADPMARYTSVGNLIRECPSESEPRPFPYIQACFGYVNADIYRRVGRPKEIGHSPPTVLGREVYREVELKGQTVEFVLQMIDDTNEQAALRAQAKLNVENRPASEVVAGSEVWRVNAEYEKLRCEL